MFSILTLNTEQKKPAHIIRIALNIELKKYELKDKFYMFF